MGINDVLFSNAFCGPVQYSFKLRIGQHVLYRRFKFIQFFFLDYTLQQQAVQVSVNLLYCTGIGQHIMEQ
ncbi:hypothetical protein D3C86_2020910 [compost metagenome]